MRDYNKENANRLAQEFEQLVDVDLTSTNRRPRNVALRALFYKVLKECNYMNDRDIEEWFAERGNKRDRSSIYVALTKIELYYKEFDYFREAYDILFPNQPIKIEIKKKAIKTVLDKVNSNKPKIDKDALDELIDSIEGSRRQEVYELVKLRVKSWNWKSKDQCKIINCSESIGDFVY